MITAPIFDTLIRSTTDSTPTITGSAEAGSRVSIYNGTTLLGTTLAEDDGRWNFTPANSLGRGSAINSLSLWASATTISGETSAASSIYKLAILPLAYKPTILLPFDSIQNNRDLVIAGTGLPLSTITVFDNNAAIGTTTSDSSGKWSFKPSVSFLETKQVPYTFNQYINLHSISVESWQESTRSLAISEKYKFKIDDTAPRVAIDTTNLIPQQGKDNFFIAQISGTTIITNTDPDTASIQLFNGSILLGTAELLGGLWKLPLDAMTEGEHHISAIATDYAGNKSLASTAITLVIDKTAPIKPTFSSLSKVTNDVQPTLSGQAEANSYLLLYRGGTQIGSTTADSSGYWQFKLQSALTQGSYSFTAKAKDAAGNVSASSNVTTITVDLTPPLAPILQVLSPTNNNLPWIGVSAETGSIVSIYDNSILIADNIPVLHGSIGFWPSIPLKDGIHLITAVSTDTAGNKSLPSKGASLTIDTTAPLAPIITEYPTLDYINFTNPVLKGTAEANSRINFYNGTTPNGFVWAAADGKWSAELSGNEGLWSITASSTDAAGNTSSSSSACVFTVDTIAPTVTMFNPSDGGSGIALTSNILVTFSEAVKKGTGQIQLRSGSITGNLVETFDVAASTRLSFTENTVTIDPTSNFATGTQYFVTFTDGNVIDLAGNSYAGTMVYGFTTAAVADRTAPIIKTSNPAAGSTGVDVTCNIVLTFSEVIQKGTGLIQLRSGSAMGAIIESFDVANSTRLNISGDLLTINPTSDLENAKQYFVTLAVGTIKDLAGNNYAGTTAYNFTTLAAPIQGTIGNDNLVGTIGADIINGLVGNDTITGGAGADALDGGDGSDVYVIALAGDYATGEVIADTGSSGSDEVRFASATVSTLTLASSLSGIERVVIGTGTATIAVATAKTGLNVDATAASSNLTMVGNAGSNILTGGSGNDSYTGGLGIDTFVIKSGMDSITDLGLGGADVIRVSNGATLNATVTTAWTATSTTTNAGTVNITTNGLAVNLGAITGGTNGYTVTDIGGATSLTGSNKNDSLNGGVGNDTITGGAGADVLDGGDGSDIYVIALAGDYATGEVIADTGSSGSDEVRFISATASTLTLASSLSGIERVVIGTGTATIAVATTTTGLNVDATAVSSNLTMAGNAGSNILTGGSGNDSYTGGLGIDTFVIKSGMDSITDLGLGGADVIQVSNGATLNATVTTAWKATSTTTNAGTVNITTNGLAVNLGAITGGTNGFSITNNGAGAALAGSTKSDTISGSMGKDTIQGGVGNDIIQGKAGTDSMSGGTGSDTFKFSAGDSGQTSITLDIITDFAKGVVGTGDVIDYNADLTIGGSAATATSTQALINQTTGIATFASSSGTTLADALADIVARFTAGTDAAGEFAFFKVNATGNYYLFISDGTAGLGISDVLVQLTGITAITTTSLSSGNLGIVA
jgi:Ca2+-binding RTX toxin-like protein